ncbi:MAG: sigma-70 family RNA polymerase sigma factor [Planctomycetota bacterium]|nr:MAG: sigma-70 family RNA polymerase sigma factor [Planctomycetota bacterium]
MLASTATRLSSRMTPAPAPPPDRSPKPLPDPGPVERGRGAVAPRAEGASEARAVESSAGADHDAVRRAQRGDAAAFEELVRRHERGAVRVALNLVGRREDAEDLVQEAFLRVFRNLERFDFQYEFSTWLYRIVTNQAIDWLRRRRPAHSTTAREDDEPEIELPDVRTPAPSRGLELGEEAARVRECLSALAPHFQAVLVLREMEGMACTEIADIVGATHVTVRWRLHRGRKLFQEEWERRERLNEQELGLGGPDADAARQEPED